jgi:hypothetical protein
MSPDVSEIRAASNIRAMMMEVARTSETAVDIQLTRQYIPEDSELQLPTAPHGVPNQNIFTMTNPRILEFHKITGISWLAE